MILKARVCLESLIVSLVFSISFWGGFRKGPGFNKIDAFTYIEKDADDLSEIKKENYSLEDWKNSWMAKNNTPSIFISAKEKQNIDELKALLYDEVKKIHITRFPFNDFLYPTNLETEE